MAPTGSIKSFFRRATFAPEPATPDVPASNANTTTRQSNSDSSPAAAEDDDGDGDGQDNDRATSPLSEPPPSSSLARNASGLFSSSPVVDQQPHQQQVLNDLKEASKQDDDENKAEPEPEPEPVRETSFGSLASHRTIKNGQEVVTGSDGEESDSAASLESPDDLFARLLGPRPVDGADDDKKKKTRTPKSNTKNKALNYSVPKYKNTLDALVTEAVDDNETEAGIAQLRATLAKSEDDVAAIASTDAQGRPLHEDMLTSALGDQGDEQGYQRLLDAVRRTEVFEQDKTVSVFTRDIASAPEFPKSAVAPGTYLAALRGGWSLFYVCWYCG